LDGKSGQPLAAHPQHHQPLSLFTLTLGGGVAEGGVDAAEELVDDLVDGEGGAGAGAGC